MQAGFWHQKWERGEIAFHQNQVNPLLAAYSEKLNLTKGARVFLPLCGKTLDMEWLLANEYRVVGAELSDIAIAELFQSLGLQPQVVKAGALMHYSAENIDIYVGDIFDLTALTLGAIDAIYDRAAIVALPADIRKVYAAHLMSIGATAPQLVITYEYDQSLIEGPPFSVSEAELRQHYGTGYEVTALETKHVEGGMKGKAPSTETVWLLQRLNL